MTKLSVIGCGYLGAVHAACMAELGHEVVGLEVDPRKVALLRSGRAPFHEPGFDDLLVHALATGRLTFTTDPAAVAGAQVHFICVGPPSRTAGTPQTSRPSTPPSRLSSPTSGRTTTARSSWSASRPSRSGRRSRSPRT